ncbi:MAG TPA: beta-phosphoglucomutase [Defluviitaleaceae bacterium]|nr:beta-phosphoglucomutase [Candidatus Epulonipiscium sp.]HOQ16447.1 beta-phosphoglucomutase [Defluviitaleaceae bacterium]HPT77124.1 beta-phosphoglucomutase [Defluviitaleaceae bacterium]HQD50275.1 beta-phosphoglucomutase [Defluviitaleaceae bacterium]
MLKGVIFDLDGVITNTAEYHYQAWAYLGKEIGIEIDRTFNEKLKGISRMESLELILEHGNKADLYTKEEKMALAEKKNNYYKESIKQMTKKDLLPGIEKLLQELKDHQIKIALASASKNGPMILKKLEIEAYFDYIVNPAHIKNGKPAPDIFLDALNGLGLKAQEAIAIEDARAGVEAIQKAGMIAVGVGVEADVMVNSTEELSYDFLVQVLASFN